MNWQCIASLVSLFLFIHFYLCAFSVALFALLRHSLHSVSSIHVSAPAILTTARWALRGRGPPHYSRRITRYEVIVPVLLLSHQEENIRCKTRKGLTQHYPGWIRFAAHRHVNHILQYLHSIQLFFYQSQSPRWLQVFSSFSHESSRSCSWSL